MLGGQESKADLASSKGDVRVRDLRREVDGRRCEGVVRRDCDAKVPKAAC